MALQFTSRADYVKTGESPKNPIATFFTKASNWASFSPIAGGFFAGVFGIIATAADTIGWLFQGKIFSAGTAFAAGSASTAVNASVASGGVLNPLYWGNVVQGAVTGRSAGTHARKVTESVIGGIGGVVGMRPEVLGPKPNGFLAAEAGRRGQSVDDAWARVNSNNADHVAALQAANQGAAIGR